MGTRYGVTTLCVSLVSLAKYVDRTDLCVIARDWRFQKEKWSHGLLVSLLSYLT